MEKQRPILSVDITQSNKDETITPRFMSTADIVRVTLKSTSAQNVKLSIYSFDSHGSRSLNTRNEYLPDGDGNIEAELTFDPVSLAVYKDACEFEVAVSGAGKHEIFISEQNASAVDDTEDRLDNTTTISDGTRGVLVTQANGERITVPLIPKKVVFVGNSLVFGMFHQYGMCASAPDKDYFHYVTEYIRKFEPNCQFKKQYGSFFEHSESLQAFDKWFYQDDQLTGKGAVESFTDDVDLVFLQVGDNVNTDLKQKTFTEVSAELLVKRIKERCPHARIIWIHGWYNRKRTLDKIKEICGKWQIERIDTGSLYLPENQALDQKTCIGADGSVQEISPRWITHPGDIGMKKIAAKIIAKLRFE